MGDRNLVTPGVERKLFVGRSLANLVAPKALVLDNREVAAYFDKAGKSKSISKVVGWGAEAKIFPLTHLIDRTVNFDCAGTTGTEPTAVHKA